MSKKEKIIKSMDLIKESWQIYTKNLVKFLEVFVYGLVGIIPMFGIFAIATLYARFLGDKAPMSVNVIFGIVAFVSFVASICLAIVYSVRIKVASILLLKNNFTSAKENFKAAKPYFVKFLGVSMLLMVLVIAWGFVFIIPALIFAIYYGFAQYVLIAEDKRPFSAIERSYDLVRGYWWPVFGRLALLSVITIFVYWILLSPMNSMQDGETITVLYSIFINVISAILSPYFLIYAYKIYQSLKETNK